VNPWADLPSAIRWPLSFAVPFAAALVLTPLAGRAARRLGELDHPSGASHKTHADATPNLGGYPIGGVTLIDLPNSHLQYAVTWYGLAAALIAIMGVAWWRRALPSSS
jgi:cytochrome oxidase assembly protein ShyY1